MSEDADLTDRTALWSALSKLAEDVAELSFAVRDLESKIDRGYKLAGAVRGYLGIVGATRELGGWERELQKVLTTFESPGAAP
jgi:hypothetical protein